ncbi:DUF5063 domain-containing protein [Nocardioides perillae]|uniref:DUF5063 domain-containing protein n=1 Tax=Nocardioides perillae TaxID=1119534 RepID=A0A7Y9RQG3_9ACTN|nr:DUF5063 domain-containing protein [Nocardioides perillae]NYG54430.1 hypothetical protein [Nocardioides perillae]
MTEPTTAPTTAPTAAPTAGGGEAPPRAVPVLDSDTEDLAQQVADQVESFLLALRAIAREGDGGSAVSLLLLEVSQVLLAGARLGVLRDFTPDEEFQPDAGPDPDLDELRLRLAETLDGVDLYVEVLDPYGEPEVVPSTLSDDLASTAAALAHGLRHHRAGRVLEALWWWQFSYVASWGTEASAALRALQSVVAHDRLDDDRMLDAEQVLAAGEMLAGQRTARR